MRVHPFVAGAAVLLAGVIALGASLVVERHNRRSRRPPPPPEEADPPPPPPRQWAPAPPPPRAVVAPAPKPPAAVLRVRVTGPHGLYLEQVEVTAFRPELPDDSGTELAEEEDEDGRYTAEDLEPGRYDVLVEAAGMRPVRLTGVPTSDRIVQVSLARRAVLLGSIGVPGPGGGCADMRVVAAEPPDENRAEPRTLDTSVDASSCTFAIEDLRATGQLTVIARGLSRQIED